MDRTEALLGPSPTFSNQPKANPGHTVAGGVRIVQSGTMLAEVRDQIVTELDSEWQFSKY